MFSREKIDKLFSYRFNDYKIDIMLEKKLDFDFIYEMLQDKLKILKKYLNNNFIKKFIYLSYSFIALFVFFARKFNKDLYLCVNYRVFNVIIIKNRYSLPLIQKTLSQIYKIEIFIIFNIIVVFNKLRIIKKKK